MTPTTSQALEIHTKSRANLIPFIQKADALPLSKTKSMPVWGARESRPERPRVRRAGVWATSASKAASPMVTTGPVGTGVAVGASGVGAEALVGVADGPVCGTGVGVDVGVCGVGVGGLTGAAVGWGMGVGVGGVGVDGRGVGVGGLVGAAVGSGCVGGCGVGAGVCGVGVGAFVRVAVGTGSGVGVGVAVGGFAVGVDAEVGTGVGPVAAVASGCRGGEEVGVASATVVGASRVNT